VPEPGGVPVEAVTDLILEVSAKGLGKSKSRVGVSHVDRLARSLAREMQPEVPSCGEHEQQLIKEAGLADLETALEQGALVHIYGLHGQAERKVSGKALLEFMEGVEPDPKGPPEGTDLAPYRVAILIAKTNARTQAETAMEGAKTVSYGQGVIVHPPSTYSRPRRGRRK